MTFNNILAKPNGMTLNKDWKSTLAQNSSNVYEIRAGKYVVCRIRMVSIKRRVYESFTIFGIIISQ